MPSSTMTRTRTGRSDTMGKKLAKLVDVKSIVTFVLTGVFSYLSIIQAIKPDQFLTIFTMIISFYFGTQTGKREALEGKEAEKDESDNR